MELDKILLGDCYELIRQVPDKSVDLIVTDPPYDVGGFKGGGMLHEKGIKAMFDCLKDKNLVNGFDLSILAEFDRVMRKPNIYIWCSKRQIYPLMSYYIPKGIDYDLICWHKTNAMPMCGGKYLSDTEYCLYFHKGVKLNTTYETAKTYYEAPINQADKKLYGHPTIKPQWMMENFIVNSSFGGGVSSTRSQAQAPRALRLRSSVGTTSASR